MKLTSAGGEKESPINYVADTDGNYTFHVPASPEDIIELATVILEDWMSRGDVLDAPATTRRFLACRLGTEEREKFCVLFLDNRHRLICFEELFAGTIDGATVHPREVVKRALVLNAAAVIVAHNHPSGVPEPSESDRALTRRLKEALGLVDVRVLDHLVVGGAETVSFAERGWL
jgi:DNA repair protein RadC